MSIIPLEDAPCDVIGKAMRGQQLAPTQLAQQAGLSEKLVQSALHGEHSNDTLAKLASALNLSANALIALPHYRPDVTAPQGLYHFVTPFGHAGVNAYAIAIEGKAFVFDTGTDAEPILQFLHHHSLKLDTLYITHRHHDHTAGVTHFNTACVVYPEETHHGQVIELTSTLQLRVLDVSGHLNPARAYFFDNLNQPVCILGDAILAGSMGKTTDLQHYKLSLATARDNIMTLPQNTVLCPGHGPLTSVTNEQNNNPFLNKCLKHSREQP